MRCFAIIVVVICATSCSDLPKPFEHNKYSKKNELVHYESIGAIRVEIDNQLPHLIYRALTRETLNALAKEDILASAKEDFKSKYLLKGLVSVKRLNVFDPEQATFTWVLMTSDFKQVKTFEQVVQGAETGWLTSDPKLFRVIAEDAGRYLSAFLHPKLKTSNIFTDNSENVTTELDSLGSEHTIFLSGISGAPGNGESSLISALNAKFSAARLTAVAERKEATFVVQGAVSINEKMSGNSAVTVNWFVFLSGGFQLGTVSQSSTVPTGSLDVSWGKSADAIADGAILGIKKIVKKYIKTSK